MNLIDRQHCLPTPPTFILTHVIRWCKPFQNISLLINLVEDEEEEEDERGGREDDDEKIVKLNIESGGRKAINDCKI